MKRILSILLATSICLTLFVAPTAAFAAGNSVVLAFSPADAVSNGDGSIIYLSDSTGRKVYSLNTLTFEQKSISFGLIPESMCYKEGKLYVSLCKQAHNSYWWTEEQSGAFAIIDCATFTVSAMFNINIDPYDIVVSKDDIVYIASGSGQWTDICGYNQAGGLVAKGQIRHMSTIKYNEALNRIYTITSDVSPRNMSAFNILADYSFNDRGGNMGTSYGWPYHGAFSSSNQFEISPDGKYIFNSIGYIMDCAEDKAEDMIKARDLNKSYNDVAFDLSSDLFYLAVTNNMIHSFGYHTYLPEKSFLTSTGSPQRIFLTYNDIIALTKAANNVFCIERISKSSGVTPNMDNDYGVVFKSEVTSAVYSPVTHKTYIIDKGAKELRVLDHTTETTQKALDLPIRPDGLNLSADGMSLWIVNDSSAYLATEYDLLTLGKKREIAYSVPLNWNAELPHKHIVTGAGKIFISDGQWEPQIYVFDEHTLEYKGNFAIKPGIGGMYIDETQQYLYTWYQYGWSAGYAGSRVYKYDISGVLALQVDQFEPASYTTLDRDPLDSPFIPYDGDKLILKYKVFNTANLSSFYNMFTETIYAVDAVNRVAAGMRGLYNLDTGILIRPVNFNGSKAILFDRDGELYFSRNGTMLRYKVVALTVNATNLYMRTDETKQLMVNATFSDGGSFSVTESCVYASSDPAVATVNSNGLISAVGSGVAEITVAIGGAETKFIVGVDIDVTTITVDGYDIGFSTSKIDYYVELDAGATDVPEVTADFPAGVVVNVYPAAEIPGYTVVEVSDSLGLFKKTYTIHFDYTPPVYNTEMPFKIVGNYERRGNLIWLNLWLVINPNYYGVVPEHYYLVIQLVNRDHVPALVAAVVDTNQITYTFSDEYFAMIMVVDQFGRKDYIGKQLAVPAFTTNLI